MAKEIEIKYRIDDLGEMEEQLASLGCRLTETEQQEDILFNSRYRDFEPTDEALRLRVIRADNHLEAVLTYKGTPHLDDQGLKHREEHEIAVNDPAATRAILEAVDFYEELIIAKERRHYQHSTLHLTIDTLQATGRSYLELEGEEEAIHQFAAHLDITEDKIEREPYFRILFPDFKTRHQLGTVPPRE